MLGRVERPAIQAEVHLVQREVRRQILYHFEQHFGQALLECRHPQPAGLAGLQPRAGRQRPPAIIQQRGNRIRLYPLVIVQGLRHVRLAAGQFTQQPGVGRPPQRAEDGVAVGGGEGEEEGEEHFRVTIWNWQALGYNLTARCSMERIRVEEGFRISIPETLRPSLKIGDELLIAVDKAGRVVLIPESRVNEILETTFGMWRDRQDIPTDGVEYVAQLRQGRRLRRLADESD